MKISHDTLLEYSYKIVDENDLLKQIICDTYPYILVDEYQDINCKVVKIFNLLEKYSKAIKHDVLVGYFGDNKQNIYDSGVGKRLLEIHPYLERVEKVFNRRSAKEIINIANKIRNDELKQETIYENFSKGSVSFYNMKVDKQEFIEKHIEKWDITEKNKLHCLELTNEFVAKQSGLTDIYDFFKEAPWYKRGKNFQFLSDHILSLDTEKLGIVQNLLFRILDFKNKVNNDKTMILDIIKKSDSQFLTILELRSIILKLKNIKGDTLKEYITNMFDEYNKGDEIYDGCIGNIIGNENKTYIDIENYILKNLFFETDSDEQLTEDIEESKKKVESFLTSEIKKFDLWYDYILNKSADKVIYHTYHSTKGLEIKNVIILMKSAFGRDKEFFNRLLSNLDNNIDNEKLEQARNLLYVAVTRATLNLSILYSDDIVKFEKDIENVFGKVIKNL